MEFSARYYDARAGAARATTDAASLERLEFPNTFV
jgi:hypothetical protein